MTPSVCDPHFRPFTLSPPYSLTVWDLSSSNNPSIFGPDGHYKCGVQCRPSHFSLTTPPRVDGTTSRSRERETRVKEDPLQTCHRHRYCRSVPRLRRSLPMVRDRNVSKYTLEPVCTSCPGKEREDQSPST